MRSRPCGRTCKRSGPPPSTRSPAIANASRRCVGRAIAWHAGRPSRPISRTSVTAPYIPDARTPVEHRKVPHTANCATGADVEAHHTPGHPPIRRRCTAFDAGPRNAVTRVAALTKHGFLAARSGATVALGLRPAARPNSQEVEVVCNRIPRRHRHALSAPSEPYRQGASRQPGWRPTRGARNGTAGHKGGFPPDVLQKPLIDASVISRVAMQRPNTILILRRI